ncbi:ABC transporter ATP-binding protein [Lachnospiraceae bacterium 45-P1]
MAEQKEKVLEIKNLNVKFVLEEETVEAVNDISLHMEKGETLGLVGETGAGKTTTALSILRLIDSPPGVMECEKLEVCGKDIKNMSISELEHIRGSVVSMIFQDPMTSLNPVFTVGQQIAESLERHENLNKNEAWKKAEDMLELVGIPRERAIEYPHQFSGGMKQRVIIAIALACSPQLLIADEPTTALDVTIQAQILHLMKELKEKKNTSMIMITHDLGIVAETCDRVAVMYAGRIIEEGNLDEVFNHTLHPYTEGLFNSLPNIKNRRAKLQPIHGLMPDPTNLPKGCAFAPRCNYATEACQERRPQLTDFGGTHKAACLAYENKDFHIERGKKNG